MPPACYVAAATHTAAAVAAPAAAIFCFMMHLFAAAWTTASETVA